MTYATSRKLSRKTLTALLTQELITNRSLVQAVYDNQVGDFGAQSPVVVVSSGGTNQERQTFAGSNGTYWLNVHIFVLYATEDGSWTEANAEDALDDINRAIFDLISSHQTNTAWESLEIDRPSEPGSVVVGGVEYRTELIRIRVI